jgi:hypothetical protein
MMTVAGSLSACGDPLRMRSVSNLSVRLTSRIRRAPEGPVQPKPGRRVVVDGYQWDAAVAEAIDSTDDNRKIRALERDGCGSLRRDGGGLKGLVDLRHPDAVHALDERVDRAALTADLNRDAAILG